MKVEVISSRFTNYTGGIENLEKMGAEITVLPHNDKEFPYYNPSIAWHKGKLHINIRSCNYTHINGRVTLGRHAHAMTKNMYGTIDPDTLKIDSLTELKYDKNTPEVIRKISGLEDARLFVRDDKLHFLGVEVNTSERNTTRASMALFRLNGDTLEYIETLAKPKADRHEKNWGVPDEPSELFDYSYSPTEVWKDGKVIGDRYTGNIHGGTQLIWQPDRKSYLAVVHDIKNVVDPTKNQSYWDTRKYIHYFAEYDAFGQLINLSAPFQFQGKMRIEFASGMVEHKDDLLISFGIMDGKPAIARFNKQQALSMLKPYYREDEKQVIELEKYTPMSEEDVSELAPWVAEIGATYCLITDDKERCQFSPRWEAIYRTYKRLLDSDADYVVVVNKATYVPYYNKILVQKTGRVNGDSPAYKAKHTNNEYYRWLKNAGRQWAELDENAYAGTRLELIRLLEQMIAIHKEDNLACDLAFNYVFRKKLSSRKLDNLVVYKGDWYEQVA